jgi:hypothetical protein
MPLAQSLQRVYRLFNLAKISLGILLLTSICSQVNAQSAAVFKDSTGAIFLYGLQPDSRVEIGIVGNLVKAIAPNQCGLLVIHSDSAFSVDGQTVNPANITDVRSLASNCSAYINYPNNFKTPDGAIAIRKSLGAVYAIAFANHKTTRQVSINACGYAILRNVTAASLNLPTVTGGRGDFAIASLPKGKSLACVRGNLYFPVGFNPRNAMATATSGGIATGTSTTSNQTTNSNSTTNNSNTAINSQTAQPQAARSGDKLIISSIPPGTYSVVNAANPVLKKTYTVTGKACLVAERSQLGNATNFLVSRQGLTLPISWGMLPEIPVSKIPTC